MEALACFCWVRAAVCHTLALSYKHAIGRPSIWMRINWCVCLLLGTVPSDSDCLTVGRLLSETQTPRLWFMRGRRDRGYMRRENIPQHTHTYRSVTLEKHTNRMSLTLFITLLLFPWKWTAACIRLMNWTTVRHVNATWMKCSTCTLTHWQTCTRVCTYCILCYDSCSVVEDVFRSSKPPRSRFQAGGPTLEGGVQVTVHPKIKSTDFPSYL